MRGIELRQHITPLFFKNVQQSMLRVFQEATNTWVFQQQIPYAIEVLFDAAYCLCKHDVNLDDLVFTTRISKVISSYKVDTFAKAALKQLQQFNIYLKPGQIVQYLVCDHHSSDSVNRVCVKELITEQTSFDVRFYLRYLAQCGETLLFPFEYTAEMLENMMLKKVGLRA
jgi:DNA polymerase elongation subunit (family B)